MAEAACPCAGRPRGRRRPRTPMDQAGGVLLGDNGALLAPGNHLPDVQVSGQGDERGPAGIGLLRLVLDDLVRQAP